MTAEQTEAQRGDTLPFCVDWENRNPGTEHTIITPKSDSPKRILLELLRQADRIKRVITLPGENPLTDEEALGFLPGVVFSKDGGIVSIKGSPLPSGESGKRISLIHSPSKLIVEICEGSFAINSSVFDVYNGQGSAEHLVRSTMIELEINRTSME